jgi:hypothetical protein
MAEIRRRFSLPIVAAMLAAIAAIAATALLVNIFTRQQEARNPFYRVVELTDDTEDPAHWGQNFPLQYDGYRRTVDQVRTRYGGTEAAGAGRSAVGRRAEPSRGRSATQTDVGRLGGPEHRRGRYGARTAAPAPAARAVLLDFIEAENSMGFHADQEAVRILALSIDESRRGQASLPGSKATPGAETKFAPAAQQVSPGTTPGRQDR